MSQTREAVPAERARRSRLGIVALTVFLDLLGFGIIIPLMPHYAESMGASPFLYGLLAASYSLMQFFFVPVWGRLSDRVGRRPILLLSVAGSAVSFTLFGFARSLEMLFAARILSGIFAANLSVAQAYVADVTSPEHRARGMGMIGAAFGLGFVVGPFVGGELSTVALRLPFGLEIAAGTAPFFFAAALAAANWILAFFRLPESLRRADSAVSRPRVFALDRLREAVRRPGTGALFAVSFLVTFAFSMMEQTLILFGERRLAMTPIQAGRLLGFVGVIMVIVQGGMVGRLARRYGEWRLLIAGTFLIVPGLLMIPPAHSMIALAAAMIPLAVGSGLGNPSLNALISRKARGDEQGGVLGLNQSLSSLARVAGPSLGGYLFGAAGIGSPYWVGGVVMAAAGALVIVAARRETAVPAKEVGSLRGEQPVPRD